MANKKVPRVVVQCQQCGCEKQIRQKLVDQFKFCSNKCKFLAKQELIPWNKVERQEKICKNILCKKVFTSRITESPDFCSLECFNKTNALNYKNTEKILKQVEENKAKRAAKLEIFKLRFKK